MYFNEDDCIQGIEHNNVVQMADISNREENNLVQTSTSLNFLEALDSDDSIRDPDYNLESDNEEDSDSEIEQNKNCREPEQNENCREPEQSMKGKKRKRNPRKWRRNVMQQKVIAGEEHFSKASGSIPAKALKEPCQNTCRLKCSQNISPEHRKLIFKKFWSPNKSVNHKRQFVASHVKKTAILRERPVNGTRAGKRQHSREYFFEINNEVKKVCKSFFLNTLNVSQTFITTALQKKQEGGIIEDDKRGKHSSHKKTPEFVKGSVRDHIQGWAKVWNKIHKKCIFDFYQKSRDRSIFIFKKPFFGIY